jgi:hypothetical protein
VKGELEERIRQVLGWREILLSDDEEQKRELIESLAEKDLLVALSALDPLTDDELDYAARFR